MKARISISCASLLVLSGCLEPADCDANKVGNVLTSLGCSSQGQFDARIDNIESNRSTITAEVERERIAISRANTRIRALQAEQRLSSAQLSWISSEISALNSDVDRLAQTSDPGASAALRANIAKRKAAINSLAQVAVI